MRLTDFADADRAAGVDWAVEVNGAVDSVLLGADDVLAVESGELAAALWVKVDVEAYSLIFNAGNAYQLEYYPEPAPSHGKLFLRLRQGNGLQVVGAPLPSTLVDTWGHVAFSVEYGGDVVFYLDGAEIHREAYTLGEQLSPYVDVNSLGQGLDGKLADFRLYHRALTAAQIAGLATDAAPLPGVLSTVEYTYDVYNRRIRRAVDDEGDGEVDTTERYVYDVPGLVDQGDHIVLRFVDEDGDSIAQADELANRYLHGNVVDQIFADEQVEDLLTEGEVLWPLTDNLGSVRDLAIYDEVLDITTIANHIVYNAFGLITHQSNDDVNHIFTYTGREIDEETGLYYYRERYYDPLTALFIGVDPILEDYNNSYRYVGNSPTNATDPSGMATKMPRQGTWHAGKSPASPQLTATQVAARGHTGWFHPQGGIPVEYVGPMAVDFSNARIIHEGRTWTVEIEATGDQGMDTDLAERMARAQARKHGIRFGSAAEHGGTWHHLRFDEHSGKMQLELVDTPTHTRAIHTGAFDDYLNWAADKLASPAKLKKLNPTQQQGIEKALKSHPDRLKPKLIARKANLPIHLLEKFVRATRANGTGQLDLNRSIPAKGQTNSKVNTRATRVGVAFGIFGFFTDIYRGVQSIAVR